MKKYKIHTLLVFFSALLLLLFNNTNAQLAEGKDKFLGNIIAGNVPSNFSTYWNNVTAENGAKWGPIQSGGPNSWNWAQADLAYNYAQEHGYKYKYHCFVWGNQQPSWVNSSNVVNALQTYMNNVKSRYPDIWAIDVVNEPLHAVASYVDGLGGSGATGWDWVITSFEMARATFPDKVLLINEYGTENDPSARSQFMSIIRLLKDRGLVDGIGLQAHEFNLDYMSAAQMQSCLDDYATLGLPIYISELDIIGGSEAGQRAKYEELFPVMWNHPSVKGITLWGYIEGQTWRTGTGILNSNGTERQAMTWLKSFMASVIPPITVEPALLNFDASASSGSIEISSSASGWTVTSDQPWLTVSPSTGSNNGTVTVTASANTGTSSRAATVTVSASGTNDQTVTIIQAGTGGGTEISINVGGSTTGLFLADQYSTGGTTYTNSNTVSTSQITGNVPPVAIFSTERYGDFTYTIPNLTPGSAQTVTLYFAETYITSAGERLFNVSINGTSVLSNFDIYAEAGGGDNAIARTFNTTANGSGEVVLQFSSVVENAKVNGIAVVGGGQTTPTLSVTPSTLSVAAAAGSTATIDVSSNTDWAVSSSATWLSVSPVSGADNGTITVTAQANTGSASRSATVTVSATDLTPQTVTVTQASASAVEVTGVTVSPTSESVSIGGTAQLTATVAPANATNKSVTWSSSDPAIATVSASGVVTGVAAGSAVITVATVDQAKTATATITVTGGTTEPCANPVAITAPFSQDGAGEYCWTTTQDIAYINSWNMDLLEINGVDYTNTWSNNLPAAIDGKWYIHYIGSFPWSHFEAPAVKNASENSIAENQADINVFPNPVTDVLNISLSEAKSEVSLLSVNGALIKVLTTEDSKIAIDMTDYEAGIYMLRIATEGQTITKRIIKK